MKKDPLVFIAHILESISKVEEYLRGVSSSEFFVSTKLQDSVIRRIEIIGEAVKNIPNSVKTRNKDIPWKKVAGMRDILIHKYFGVDIKLTWETAKNELPRLKRELIALKKALQRPSS